MGYVIFRLDDVQDGWLIKPQTAIINLFLQNMHGVLPISLGLIGRSFKDKTLFSDYLESVFSDYGDACELVCHGLTHTDFSTMGVAAQRNEIKFFIEVMENFFPEQEITSFIPPFNRYTTQTIEFLREYGIDVISGANGRYEVKDLFATPALMHANITTNGSDQVEAIFRDPDCIINDIKRSVVSDTDWCVVMMHPQEFSLNEDNIVNPQAIEKMQIVLEWCLSAGHEILNMRQMRKKSCSPEYAIKYFENFI